MGILMETKAQQLINCMHHEIELLAQLNRHLLDEKQALVKRDFSALEQFASQKETISEQLSQAATKRVELMGSGGTTEDSNAMQLFLKTCTPQEIAQINPLKTQLADQIKICRDQNLVNGQVIVSNMNTRKEIIGALQGKDLRNTGTYTAKGEITEEK